MTSAAAAETWANVPETYPVQVTFDREQRVNRLWGIPILGWALRLLVLIPNFVVWYILQIVVGLTVLVSWIPVLFLGRQSTMLVSLYVTTARYLTRSLAWALFMVGPVAPFLPSTAPYPVNVEVEPGEGINRLWGIPFLGLYARALLVFPHAILLFILYFPILAIGLVVWIPILVNGRLPQVAFTVFGGALRIWIRSFLWILLVPVPYPPFNLD